MTFSAHHNLRTLKESGTIQEVFSVLNSTPCLKSLNLLQNPLLN
jgi:hypothetical protein